MGDVDPMEEGATHRVFIYLSKISKMGDLLFGFLFYLNIFIFLKNIKNGGVSISG